MHRRFQGNHARHVLGERVETETDPEVFGVFGTGLVAVETRIDSDEVTRPRLRENELRGRVFVGQIRGARAVDTFLESRVSHGMKDEVRAERVRTNRLKHFESVRCIVERRTSATKFLRQRDCSRSGTLINEGAPPYG